jgi:hypothetical protein
MMTRAPRQFVCYLDQFVVEELSLVNADDLRTLLYARQHFASRGDSNRFVAHLRMGNDVVVRITHVDGGLEDLHFLARDACAAQAAYQLFGLAGKHRTRDNFNPAGYGAQVMYMLVVALCGQFFHLSLPSKRILPARAARSLRASRRPA